MYKRQALTIARIITIAVGISTLWACFFDKQKKASIRAVNTVFYIGFAVLLFFLPNLITASISRLTGLWSFINFLIYGFSGVLLFYNKAPGRVWSAIRSIISLFFTIIFLFGPITNVTILTRYCGVYMILFSLSFFSDFIRELYHLDITGEFIPKAIHVSLPAFLVAFIPQRILDWVNQTYDTAPSEIPLHLISSPDLAMHSAANLRCV